MSYVADSDYEKKIPMDEWQNCNDCSNIGRYSTEDGDIEFEQIQCEFCYTNPWSVFHQKSLLEVK